MNPSKLIPILGTIICIVFSAMTFYIFKVVENAPVVIEPEPNVLFTPEVSTAREQTSLLDTYMAPSETPMPINYGEIPVTQTAVALEEMDAAAQATLASSASTQSAVAQSNDYATATRQAQSTSQAAAQATSDRISRDQAAQEQRDRAESERQAYEKQAQATLAVVFEYVWKVGGSVILILAICLGMLYYFRVEKLKANRKAVERVSGDFLNNLSPITVQVSTDKHSGFLHSVNITPAETLVLKQAVIDLRGDLSRSKIVAGKYFSERRWNALDDELIQEGPDQVKFFERDSKGIHPTEAGYRWLGLPLPAPPLEEKSLETVEFPVIPVTPRHVTGVTQVENIVKAEE